MVLRVIKSDQLIPDPDVQLQFTLNQRQLAHLAAEWDDSAVGVLVVAPLNGDRTDAGEQIYGVVEGRHRLTIGKRLGVPEFRCDIHTDCTTPAQKAALKMKYDRDRRRVTQLEHFLQRVLAEEPAAIEIKTIVEAAGFQIGKCKASKPFDRIEAVSSLMDIYMTLGAEGLRRTLSLNTTWKGDPKTNTGVWIKSLALLVRDGYDDALSPSGWARLKDVVPAIVIRQAQGRVDVFGGPAAGQLSTGLTKAIATDLRKKARLRVRPAVSLHPKGQARTAPLK